MGELLSSYLAIPATLFLVTNNDEGKGRHLLHADGSWALNTSWAHSIASSICQGPRLNSLQAGLKKIMKWLLHNNLHDQNTLCITIFSLPTHNVLSPYIQSSLPLYNFLSPVYSALFLPMYNVLSLCVLRFIDLYEKLNMFTLPNQITVIISQEPLKLT